MCPCCNSCSKKSEKELPENELWLLFRAAYEQYKSEILNGEKAYSRYVNDFFSYHLPVVSMNEANTRLHVMHVCAVKEMLEERVDLVNAFFSKGTFGEEEYQQMFYLFNTGKSLVIKGDYLAHFSNHQAHLIANFVNEVSLFMVDVSDQDIKNLFECKLDCPLQANSNRHVALFFGSLRSFGMLPFQWQMIMEKHKLISSSATNKPLRASQLRCGLSQAKSAKLTREKMSNQKSDDAGFESVCNDFVKRLKESM